MCVHHERLGEGVWILRHSMKSDKGAIVAVGKTKISIRHGCKKALATFNLIRSGDLEGIQPHKPLFTPQLRLARPKSGARIKSSTTRKTSQADLHKHVVLHRNLTTQA